MKFAGAQRTKIARYFSLNHRTKFFLQPWRLEPRKRQMRRKGSLFRRNAEFLCSPVNISCQSLQVRRSFNARPENARMFFVWKKAESTKFQRDGLLGPHFCKRSANAGEFCLRCFTDKFERHVQIFGPHPFSLWRDRAKGMEQVRYVLSDRLGHLQLAA